jgi:toxin ParE1/3/4
MGQQIIWTIKAEKGLQAIFEFIALDSPIYAERFVTKLVTSTEHQLGLEPKQGRYVPELANTPIHFLRELIIDGYRVIYREDDSACVILTVMSGRMDFLKNF